MDKGNSFGNGAVTPSFINKIDQAAAAFGVYKFEGATIFSTTLTAWKSCKTGAAR